jgi:hypothetical protein
VANFSADLASGPFFGNGTLAPSAACCRMATVLPNGHKLCAARRVDLRRFVSGVSQDQSA